MTEDVTSAPPSTESRRGPNKPQRSKLAGLMWLARLTIHAGVLLAVLVLGIVLLGVAQRVGWIENPDSVSVGIGEGGGEAVYTCPMHPEIRQNKPGKCPKCGMELVMVPGSARAPNNASAAGDQRYVCPMMCTPATTQPGRCPVCAMELVQATQSSGGGDGISVSIEPAARRLLGIQTAKASEGPVQQTIRTIGSIEYDESKLATVSAYVSGRIEKLYANYVGVPVQQGDDVALLYSPELYTAQVEYLTALEGDGLRRLGSGTDLAELAKTNLVELGLSDDQIEDLRARGKADSRVRIKSPIAGTVVGKFAVEGDYLKAGDSLFRVADLSTVWLMLDLFPDDAARIRFGQSVEAEIKSMPGDIFTGRVAFIDPTVNPTTQTVRVRVEVLNLDGKLRPGDYAAARVFVPAVRQEMVYDPALAGKFISPMHPQVIRDQAGDCPICGMDLIPTSSLGYASDPLPEQHVVTIPRSALLLAGDNSVVYVETDPGRFEIRRVTLGSLTDDQAIILEGIATGETVATAGNFLIDSQMKLAGNPSLMDPSKASMYPEGPLKLPPRERVVLSGASGDAFDRGMNAYFNIQQALAADESPPHDAIHDLDAALDELIAAQDVPEAVMADLQRAKQQMVRLHGSLEQARGGFRPLSHALLRVANVVRGPLTVESIVHMYCPMVPGGGGDWMQSGGELVNPYWGAEMLHCGETIDSQPTPNNQQPTTNNQQPTTDN